MTADPALVTALCRCPGWQWGLTCHGGKVWAEASPVAVYGTRKGQRIGGTIITAARDTADQALLEILAVIRCEDAGAFH